MSTCQAVKPLNCLYVFRGSVLALESSWDKAFTVYLAHILTQLVTHDGLETLSWVHTSSMVPHTYQILVTTIAPSQKSVVLAQRLLRTF